MSKEAKPASKHEEMKEKHRANRHRRTVSTSYDELYEFSSAGRTQDSKGSIPNEQRSSFVIMDLGNPSFEITQKAIEASAKLNVETKTKIIVDDLTMDCATVAKTRRSQQPLAFLRKQFVNNINVNISLSGPQYRKDHGDHLYKIDEDDEASSLKKSAASNTHSRMSSKNSKDMNLAKMKPISEKKTQMYPSHNPIQEVDVDNDNENCNDENNQDELSRPTQTQSLQENRHRILTEEQHGEIEDQGPVLSQRELSNDHTSVKENTDTKPSVDAVEDRFFSNLPLSSAFKSKIKSKFNKSFNSKPIISVSNKKNSLKNSLVSAKPDNLSASFKTSPIEKARQSALGDADRFNISKIQNSNQHQHVHRLISNMKKGSLHIKREVEEYDNIRPEPASTNQRSNTSKFGQTLPLSPYKPDPGNIVKKEKAINHRRAYSDAESANYNGGSINASRIAAQQQNSSIVRYLAPKSPGESHPGITTTSKLQRISDLLESNFMKGSKLSFRSTMQPKRESQPEPIDSPLPRLSTSDVFRKPQPTKKVFAVSQQVETMVDPEVTKLREENVWLRLELAKKDKTIEEQAEKILMFQAKLIESNMKKPPQLKEIPVDDTTFRECRAALIHQGSDSQLRSNPSDSNISHKSGKKPHVIISLPTNKLYKNSNSSSDHSRKSKKLKKVKGK